jgi:hypothetical protein
MKNFSEFCKEYLFEQLDEHSGSSMYAGDMAYILCEGANCDGTMTYSRAEAIKYLSEWWYDAADYSEYEQMNFGERSNPFENPETYMVRMVICGIDYLLNRCEVVVESWNDELELTPEVIEAIKEQCPNEVEW